MPIATPEQYITMLETAKKEGYAYPAVNVTPIEVINGALRAFSEAKSDGIIQVSIGGGNRLRQLRRQFRPWRHCSGGSNAPSG
ncbi:MAG: class II fructose-bisphosphate aldolase [Akkermansia muciniphila]